MTGMNERPVLDAPRGKYFDGVSAKVRGEENIWGSAHKCLHVSVFNVTSSRLEVNIIFLNLLLIYKITIFNGFCG